jgi:hypothetical protein
MNTPLTPAEKTKPEPVWDWCENQGTLPNGKQCPVCEGKGLRVPDLARPCGFGDRDEDYNFVESAPKSGIL